MGTRLSPLCRSMTCMYSPLPFIQEYDSQLSASCLYIYICPNRHLGRIHKYLFTSILYLSSSDTSGGRFRKMFLFFNNLPYPFARRLRLGVLTIISHLLCCVMLFYRHDIHFGHLSVLFIHFQKGPRTLHRLLEPS